MRSELGKNIRDINGEFISWRRLVTNYDLFIAFMLGLSDRDMRDMIHARYL